MPREWVKVAVFCKIILRKAGACVISLILYEGTQRAGEADSVTGRSALRSFILPYFTLHILTIGILAWDRYSYLPRYDSIILGYGRKHLFSSKIYVLLPSSFYTL